ncbi:diaminobutyrate acetyltransferase [Vibrio hibernica]|uniref:diaminobutyrate acetyltransferase n=1 Tax=Vibrio hibernica TaxID=2587465 RepID=UPI0039AF6A18
MMITAPRMTHPEKVTNTQDEWTFRKPEISDGIQVNNLIESCPPLDTNSAYCNFLQTSHFKETCVLAERNGEVAGFVSAYLKPSPPPEQPVLFIWQVAVAEKSRGCGLAYRMIKALLERESLSNIAAIETTITKDNLGSWRLFRKIEREDGARGNVSVFLDKELHFDGEHDSEFLFHIPLAS